MNENEEKFLAIADIPSSLYITCAKNSKTNELEGFLASWVQQISFEPLLIAICIKSERLSYQSIANKQIFSMNVIGEHNKQIMKPFWSGYPDGTNPFDDLEYNTTAEGGIILKEARSTIICKARQIITPGDHNLVIAEVLDTAISKPEVLPFVHRRKSAFDY